MSKGQIYKRETMFLRVEVGSSNGNGGEYHMTAGAGDYSPIVESKQTGKYFRLSWQDIIEMAVEAGIDEEDTPDE